MQCNNSVFSDRWMQTHKSPEQLQKVKCIATSQTMLLQISKQTAETCYNVKERGYRTAKQMQYIVMYMWVYIQTQATEKHFITQYLCRAAWSGTKITPKFHLNTLKVNEISLVVLKALKMTLIKLNSYVSLHRDSVHRKTITLTYHTCEGHGKLFQPWFLICSYRTIG